MAKRTCTRHNRIEIGGAIYKTWCDKCGALGTHIIGSKIGNDRVAWKLPRDHSTKGNTQAP
jgi:hypothetical protein